MTDLAMPELQRALVDAARRQIQITAHGAPTRRRRRRGFRLRPSRWRVLPVVLALVLVGGAAAVGAKLIEIGSPSPSLPVFANPGAGLGNVTPGSVRLLTLSVPDPHGGLPWGMRVLSTTRGVGCLQVGRLLDGRLVAVGQDGAFGNDGRAHELPLSMNVERLNCSLLDGHGRIFKSVTIKSQAASAAPGVHCEPPGTYAPSHRAIFATCPLADERDLYYGMLGPDATSVTYSAGSTSHTVATVGSDGAYLIVRPGTKHRYSGAAGARERAGLYAADDVPVYSPITAIHYRSGATCQLVTAERWVYGPTSCDPQLAEPFGWTQLPVPTRAQLATPIRARLGGVKGRPTITVAFRSRVPISSLRAQYELEWHDSGAKSPGDAYEVITQGAGGDYGGLIPQGSNVAAGQKLEATIDKNPLGAPLPPGVVTGTVILGYTAGPLIGAEEDTTRVPVGTFQVRVP
jgi:hypothetical protein